jgi:hypothetical protein
MWEKKKMYLFIFVKMSILINENMIFYPYILSFIIIIITIIK